MTNFFRLEILKGRQRRRYVDGANHRNAWWGIVCQNELGEVIRCALLANHHNQGRWLRFGRVDKTGNNFEELHVWRCPSKSDLSSDLIRIAQ